MIVARTRNGLIPALTLSLLAALAAPALSDPSNGPAAAIAPATAPDAPAQAILVTLDADGLAQTGPTSAATVRDLLAEHGIALGPADYLSPAADAPLVDGTTVVYRPAVPVTLRVGSTARTVRTAAATVGDFLAESGTALHPGDRVVPSAESSLGRGDVVRVSRSWTSHVAETIPAQTLVRYTSRLPRGTSKVVRRGSAGLRIATIRTVDPAGAAPETTRLASRVAWPARSQVILRGTAPIAIVGRLAAGGLVGAERLAGAAIHVLATAYTGSCYGCSGVTASGAHAGHGIIAVDPNVIPLGTRLYIPGYGTAVAGDTGGAIVGHRIDLGFDRQVEAVGFGARLMTIYVLK